MEDLNLMRIPTADPGAMMGHVMAGEKAAATIADEANRAATGAVIAVAIGVAIEARIGAAIGEPAWSLRRSSPRARRG